MIEVGGYYVDNVSNDAAAHGGYYQILSFKDEGKRIELRWLDGYMTWYFHTFCFYDRPVEFQEFFRKRMEYARDHPTKTRQTSDGEPLV